MLQTFATHLWQSTFFALAAGLLTAAFRKNRAEVRYWLWLSASLKFVFPFALLLNLGSRLETLVPAARQIAAPAVSYTIEQFSGPFFPDGVPVSSPAPEAIHWMPIAILAVWISGFATVTLIRFRNWRRIREAVRASSATNISATVEIRVSPGLLEPGVVGLVRPILLLPEGIAERLTPAELSAVLAHELWHIRRRDNLFAAIHMIVEAIFWFHPLVWWIGARLVAEREQACDEEVLSQGNQPDVYADAILNVCKLYTESPLACVSGVSGAGIRRRIEAIMINRKVPGLNRAKKLLLASAGAVAVAGPVVIGLITGVVNVPVIHAQPVAQALAPPNQMTQAQNTPVAGSQPPAYRPKFDVGSVKRCMPGDELNGAPGGRGGGGGRGPRFSPGRLAIQCLSVATMINLAYITSTTDRPINYSSSDPVEKRFRGGPTWMYSDWYTIEAETEDPAANGPAFRKALTGPMFQTLLEVRFGLKLHREEEQVPMYALTVAKGGLRIKPMEAGGCTQLDPAQGSHALTPGDKPYCNSFGGGNHGPNRAWDIGGATLSKFATTVLSGTLDHFVLDKTGVTEVFNFHFEYAPDESTPRKPLPDGSLEPEPEPSDIPPGATIFTALEQQLGLKLVPDKGPQGYFVVDHVERPSEN